ncbi:hypothetical protein J6590_004405 [Homalodisca vitripennis]|nr:hypothetical protein J6590_004405 [Homalodisca vitripennis]
MITRIIPHLLPKSLSVLILDQHPPVRPQYRTSWVSQDVILPQSSPVGESAAAVPRLARPFLSLSLWESMVSLADVALEHRT